MAKTPTPCKCSLYAIETKGADGVEHEVIGCDVETSANFAPGHDAKLKSHLIKAGAAGSDIVKKTDEGEVTLSAMDAANEFGFASTVEKGIAKAQERAEAKAKREQAKADRLAAKKVEPGPTKAKVGRKVHEGVVLADGLTFQYEVTSGSGDEATTEVKETVRFRVVTADEAADAQADAETVDA